MKALLPYILMLLPLALLAQNSALSDMIENSNYGYSSNINYTQYQATTLTNTSTSIGVFQFILRDGGSAGSDSDALDTTLNSISFNVTNSANIRAAALFSGNALISNTFSLTSGVLSFTGLSGTYVTATDDSTKNITLRISFVSSVTDNQQLQFTIASATADSAGSQFAASNAGGASSSISADRNRIEVTADRLAFVTQPSTTMAYSTMSPAPTVSANDVNGNRDLDYTGSLSLTSTGSLSSSPITVNASSGLASLSSIVHTVAGSGLTLTVTTTGLATSNTATSSTFTISALIFSNGDYRTTSGGNWTSTSNTGVGYAGWERYSISTNTWSTYAGSPTGTCTVFIYHNVTIPTTSGSMGGASINIMNGATLTWGSSNPWTAANMHVYGGGVLQINTKFTMNSAGTFEVEDGGTVNFNYGSYQTTNLDSSLWNGTEIFHPASNFIIQNHTSTTNDFFIPTNNSISSNNYNGFTACFGNLIFDSTQTQTFQLFNSSFTKNICHGDLILRSTTSSSNSFRFAAGSVAYTTSIGGNFIIESGYNRSVSLNTGTGSCTLTIKGNLIHANANTKTLTGLNNGSGSLSVTVEGDVTLTNTSILNWNGTLGGTASIILKGDVSIASGAYMYASTTTGVNVAFGGTGDGTTAALTQSINIGSTNALANNNVFWTVNSGAYVQLAADLNMGNSGTFTVSNGGVFDFGFSGNTPLKVTKSATATGSVKFTSNSGSTLKITSPDGINSSGTLGNIILSSSNISVSTTGIFHYIGKANQVTGTCVTNTTNSKRIICELDTSSLQLSLSNSTGTSNELYIKKGIFVETDTANISGSGLLTIDTDGAFKSAVTSVTVPQLTGTYTLTGSALVELNAAGNQVLRGSRSYRNLTFSVSGVKTITSAISSITGTVMIKDAAILDVSNSSFGGSSTDLTMTDTAQFKMGGSGLKPDITGAYTLGSSTTIEFYGTSATLIRAGLSSPVISYANVVVSGSNVGTSYTATGIQFQSGGSFLVKDAATFTFKNTAGFSGATNTAICSTNNPSISCEANATLVYGGASQNMTAFSPYYPNLTISGSGSKILASGVNDITVNKNLNVSASTLQIDANKALVVNGNVTVNATATMNVESSGSLVQTDNAAINTGNINAKRNANVRADDYVYWSAPVAGADLGAVSPQSPSAQMFQWQPTVNAQYGNWISTSGTMTVGKGYIVKAPNSFSATTAQTLASTLSGVPNNGIISVSIERGNYTGSDYINPISGTTVTAQDDNWNLIGNPYPSAIKALDFLNANIQIEGAVRLWTHGTLPSNQVANPFYGSYGYNYTPDDYITFNGTATTSGPYGFGGYIASGQGFFVLMNDGPATTDSVSFNNSMRSKSYSNAQFYKSNVPNEVEKHLIWLDLVNDQGYAKRTVMGFVEGATQGRDRLYDAWIKVDENQNIYTLVDQASMVIEGRGLPFDETQVFAIGVRIPQAGTYHISIAHVQGIFEQGQSIYLYDKDLGVCYLLNESPYTFYSAAGRLDTRFELRFTPLTLNTADFFAPKVRVWTQASQYFVQSPAGEALTQVRCFDLSGRCIDQGRSESGYYQGALPDQPQVVWVEWTTSKGRGGQKISTTSQP